MLAGGKGGQGTTTLSKLNKRQRTKHKTNKDKDATNKERRTTDGQQHETRKSISDRCTMTEQGLVIPLFLSLFSQ